MTHSHSLDEINGYAVVRTIGAPDWPHNGQLIARFAGAHKYLVALETARAWRGNGSYALVSNLYGCESCDSATLAGIR